MSAQDAFILSKKNKRVTFEEKLQRTHELQIFQEKWLNISDLHELEAKTGLRCKRGMFSKTENALIRQYVLDYLRENNLKLEEFQELIIRRTFQVGSKLGPLYAHVAQKLNTGRPIVYVYLRIRRIFHPSNYMGVWSTEEDDALKRYPNRCLFI